MLLGFYLLFIALHATEGCTLVTNKYALKIIAHIGDSLLLPCHCTDVNTTTQIFKWRKINDGNHMWGDISIDGNRVQLVNAHAPGNLSLLISHVTEEDKGLYRCDLGESNYTDILLTVKGSTQIHGRELTMTAHVGGSAMLPCHCIDLHTKPKWKKYSILRYIWDDISSDGHRVQLINPHCPGNLSLLISDLTEEDEGDYRCDHGGDKYTDIKLVVKVHPESLPFVPFALVTVIFLHIIVAMVYCTKRNKDPARVHYTAEGEEREDVMYSTVVHSNTAQRPKPTDAEDQTEYASVRLN